MKFLLTCLWLLGVTLASMQPAFADTMYVIDRLQLGMHEDKAPDSAIVKLIPTGSPLEIMARDETFAQVRTEDGIVGWVDARYLMPEKPAQTELEELQAEHRETESQLDKAQLQIEDLNSRLEEISNVEPTPAEVAFQADAVGEIQRLTEENAQLKEELLNVERSAFAEVILTPPPIEQPKQTKQVVVQAGVFGLSKFQWIFIAALAVLCFGLGAYVVDYNARKRHGGFRL